MAPFLDFRAHCVMKFMRRRRKQVWKLVMLWRTVCLVFYVHYIFFCDSIRLRRSATGTQWAEIRKRCNLGKSQTKKSLLFRIVFRTECSWRVTKNLAKNVEPLLRTIALFFHFSLLTLIFNEMKYYGIW